MADVEVVACKVDKLKDGEMCGPFPPLSTLLTCFCRMEVEIAEKKALLSKVRFFCALLTEFLLTQSLLTRFSGQGQVLCDEQRVHALQGAAGQGCPGRGRAHHVPVARCLLQRHQWRDRGRAGP